MFSLCLTTWTGLLSKATPSWFFGFEWNFLTNCTEVSIILLHCIPTISITRQQYITLQFSSSYFWRIGKVEASWLTHHHIIWRKEFLPIHRFSFLTTDVENLNNEFISTHHKNCSADICIWIFRKLSYSWFVIHSLNTSAVILFIIITSTNHH